MTTPADITIAQLPDETIVGLGERIFEADPGSAGLAPLSREELAKLAGPDADRKALTPVIAWVTENLDLLLGTYPGEPPPFDHLQSYWDNFYRGPRGSEAVAVLEEPAAPRFDFLGFRLGIPFGVPACAVTPHSGYVDYFASRRFDLITYKTVRGESWNPHCSPNLAFAAEVRTPLSAGDRGRPVHPTMYPDQIRDISEASFVNSIGVPSLPIERWQADVESSRALLGPGQVLIVSVMGSPELLGEGDGERQLVDQFVRVASAAREAGAPIIELNLSCPNTGGELVCLDPQLAGKITKAVRGAVGDTPILIKISYMEESRLAVLIDACRPSMDGIVAINAVQVPTQSATGAPFFAGRPNDFAGLSGVGIRDLGLAVVRSLSKLRGDGGQAPQDWVIVGIGGVNCPADYQAYRDAGADAVQSCTGAWLNPRLAQQVASHIDAEQSAAPEPTGSSDEGGNGEPPPGQQAHRFLRLFHAVNDTIRSGGLNTRVLEQRGTRDQPR
jgi:dihydroorotate dehydrogenase (NAD+) catalytic subunit